MSANGSTIRTDGDLLYAYAAQNGTVGGVSFVRDAPLGSGGMVSASPVPAMGGGSWGTEEVSGDFGTMLQNGWNWTGEGTELSYTLTLAGLTPGKNYLVQLVMHRQSQNMLVSVNGSAQAHVNGSDEEHYKYGASIVGLFTASAATQELTVTYTERGGDRPLNAIQVRYLGDGGVDPVTHVVNGIGKVELDFDDRLTLIGVGRVFQDGKCSRAVIARKQLLVHDKAVDLGIAAYGPYIGGDKDLHVGNPLVLFLPLPPDVVQQHLHVRPVLQKHLGVTAHRHDVGRDPHDRVNLPDPPSVGPHSKHTLTSMQRRRWFYAL
jgi:hypothetical protein